jgi:hypothetical protein
VPQSAQSSVSRNESQRIRRHEETRRSRFLEGRAAPAVLRICLAVPRRSTGRPRRLGRAARSRSRRRQLEPRNGAAVRTDRPVGRRFRKEANTSAGCEQSLRRCGRLRAVALSPKIDLGRVDLDEADTRSRPGFRSMVDAVNLRDPVLRDIGLVDVAMLLWTCQGFAPETPIARPTGGAAVWERPKRGPG